MQLLFIIVAGALVLCCLSFVLRPMLAQKKDDDSDARARELAAAIATRRASLKEELAHSRISQQDYERMNVELERDALAELDDEAAARPSSDGVSANLSLMLGSAIVLCALTVAIGVYWRVGTPQALQDPAEQEEVQAQDIENLADKLAGRLASGEEKDAEAWAVLGRTAISLRRWEQAAEAFARARDIQGDSADLLVAEADARAMLAGSLTADPQTLHLLSKAVELDPEHPLGLWLSGVAAEQRGDNEQALTYLKQASKVMEDDSARKQIDDMVSFLERRVAGSSPDSTRIAVEVRLNPELAAEVANDDTIYVFARVPDGPPMPAAAWRGLSGSLPRVVVLDDSLSLAPHNLLSQQVTVNLFARISKGGEPTASSGDLFGEMLDVDLDEVQGTTLTVQISQRVP